MSDVKIHLTMKDPALETEAVRKWLDACEKAIEPRLPSAEEMERIKTALLFGVAPCTFHIQLPPLVVNHD